MELQRCCAHCPGKLTSSRDNESHRCCQPKYVTGNLKISSLRKHASDYTSLRRKPQGKSDRFACCHDKFALAKRLHAENLQHQPLPDKVDDSIFENPRTQARRSPENPTEKSRCDCERGDRPALGCKKPESRMDLAICWETPFDPVYEPPRPTHIDGSEGGSAPAIFALVRHTPDVTNAYFRSEHPGCKDDCRMQQGKSGKDESGCCCGCLCKNLRSVSIAEGPKKSARRCSACDRKEQREHDPRLIKSSVGVALGMQKPEGKARVPRPRTPFARRSFRIDTLAPPFSVVNGSRDTDYPEHWRLMTIYQRSYGNPRKRTTGLSV